MKPCYYLFEKLSEEDRAANGIKSASRFDCIKFQSNGLEHPLLPSVKKSGMLFLYLLNAESLINTHWKRKAEVLLNDGKNNISSLFFEDLEKPAFAYGYPNPKARLSNQEPNPYFSIRNHAYLFIIGNDFSKIEMLVFPGCRHQVKGYFNLLLDGNFDEMLEECRLNALPFFNYNKAKK